MKWKGRRQSDNVEDRRGMSSVKTVVGGGIIGL
jgi:predicted metalloprotease